jgi:putative heme-binding domain-containing protein
MYGTMHVVKNLDDVPAEALAPASDPALQTRPFVRAWQLADVLAELDRVTQQRSFERGKTLFTEMSCAKCHRMNGTGGQVGPDLVDVKKKLGTKEWTHADVLREMVEPSAKIAKEYVTYVVTDNDGKLHTGIIVERNEQALKLAANPLDGQDTVSIPVANIDEQFESNISLMPAGLLNTLSLEEIYDLLLYLELGGESPPTGAN